MGRKTAKKSAPRQRAWEQATSLEGLLQTLDPDFYEVVERGRERLEAELRRYGLDLDPEDFRELSRRMVEAYTETIRDILDMYRHRVLDRLPPGIRAPMGRLLGLQKA